MCTLLASHARLLQPDQLRKKLADLRRDLKIQHINKEMFNQQAVRPSFFVNAFCEHTTIAHAFRDRLELRTQHVRSTIFRPQKNSR